MSGERLQHVENKSETPRVRVYLLQGCRLEWAGEPAAQDIAWYHRSSARALFILLLCAPKRTASRSQLASLLWPETDEEKAHDSLRTVLKYVRDVLRCGQGDELLAAQAGMLTFKRTGASLARHRCHRRSGAASQERGYFPGSAAAVEASENIVVRGLAH